MVGESWEVFIKQVLVKTHKTGIMYENPGGGDTATPCPLCRRPCPLLRFHPFRTFNAEKLSQMREHRYSGEYSQGRRQKKFSGGDPTKKRPKNSKKKNEKSTISLFQGWGQRNKDRKLALLTLSLYYICTMYENPGGPRSPWCRRPCE